ncbi:armadillo-type protein [Suillus subalutaceus]|uniref:armadillo-type protein n=1 Tax=Suillus subalutaceus TaxID=48586 RepID=UPI001B8717CF|nr:armadillo-type protein [Suillus subalutaceus]KAG1846586.1 armadillo-type protein [Suillus subalutaceus]
MGFYLSGGLGANLQLLVMSSNIQVSASGQPHADDQKLSVPSCFQTGNFPSPGSKLTSEERFAISNTRSASTSSATSQFRSTMVRTPSTGGPGRPMNVVIACRRGGERGRDANKAPMSQQLEGHSSGFGAAPILGTGFEPVVPFKLSANHWVPTSTTRKTQSYAELVDREVKALLNKLTMEKFETISDQIIHWANKSVNEKDGRTLIQVIRLVYAKAINEAACNEMYARLCRKMMEQISPEVQDDELKNTEGKPIAGGQLFRKYLINRCQEDFERRWFAKEATAAAAAAKASDDHATKAAHEKIGRNDAELCFEEYYTTEKARRQGLGLIKFIGELFKLQMLTERIMHECVKKLLGAENPEEEKIESLCQLLKTVGQLLDTPKACAHMDVYFTRMKELGKSFNVSSRMQFMLQDVIELRDRKWVSQNTVAAPTTIAAVHELAAKEKVVAEKESFNRRISMSRGGSRRGGHQNQEHGPDGWAVAGGSSVPQAPPKAGDLSQFGKISKGPAMAMAMGPSGVSVVGRKDSKRETLSNSRSNMFHMLNQNPELAAEVSMKPSRSSRLKPGVDLGHTENATTPSEEEPEGAPTAMSETDVRKKIDEDVKEFFAVRNLQEAEVYFTNLPDGHRFRLVDKLVASALESKEADARLVGDFFAQATSNGQCTLEVIEEGFMPTAEFLDDIAIDAPKAFDFMAIMLRGAGCQNEPERLYRIASKLEDSDKLVSLVV